MSIPITWVDAFSEGVGGGNPAAVCLLDEPLDDARMQALAAELGISETAYLTPTDDPLAFGLRWFSPATEINLCGHATLASAHALRQSRHDRRLGAADLPHPQRRAVRLLRRRAGRAELPGRPHRVRRRCPPRSRASGRARSSSRD